VRTSSLSISCVLTMSHPSIVGSVVSFIVDQKSEIV
jgi:hypothetical protein